MDQLHSSHQVEAGRSGLGAGTEFTCCSCCCLVYDCKDTVQLNLKLFHLFHRFTSLLTEVRGRGR